MDWTKIINENRARSSKRKKGDTSNYDSRDEFETDYDRVIFSPAIRRMHDKTQVFPLITDDNIHTRLTHSLEAQAVAHSMGVNIIEQGLFNGLDEKFVRSVPMILSTSALCHDIGNTPFGHSGETSIQAFFESYFKKKGTNTKIKLSKMEKLDFTKFDGNAEGFRILTKLQVLQDPYGLNLTYGTLSAFLKYPFTADELNNGKPFSNKIGVFQSEKDLLQKIRKATGLKQMRNPLTFLMEAADNICYNIMDMEDGFNYGYYNFEVILEYLKKEGDKNLKNIMSEFEKQIKNINTNKNNIETTKIVRLRVFLIQKLVGETCKEFVKNIAAIKEGKYKKELKGDTNLIDLLRQFDIDNIYKQREIQSLELTGEKVIQSLLQYFVDTFINNPDARRAERLWNLISRSFKELMKIEERKSELNNVDDYYKLRIIVDYISGMTDSFALDLYRKLQGIEI